MKHIGVFAATGFDDDTFCINCGNTVTKGYPNNWTQKKSDEFDVMGSIV